MRFPRRFEGPPGTANGGVVAGSLAGEGPAEVIIRRPVPLEVELSLAGGELRDADGELLALARPADAVEVGEPPRLVAFEEAQAASSRSPWLRRHPFPGCFGCGPDAEHGIHCLPGPAGDGVWAVGWTPDEVSPPVVWAALDCPSSGPVVPAVDPIAPHVLGRITAEILERPSAGEPHVVLAWALGEDGRRKHAASAIVGPDGSVRARARATWVAIQEPVDPSRRPHPLGATVEGPTGSRRTRGA